MKRRLDSKLRKKIYMEPVKLTTTFSLNKLSETFTFQNKGVTNLSDRKLSLNLNSESNKKRYVKESTSVSRLRLEFFDAIG